MKKPRLFFLLILIVFVISSCSKSEQFSDIKVQIESPQQDLEVGLAELVKGKISEPKVKIYVLVHPLLTNMWWVQRIPSPPNQDGSWQALCYFGTETKGVGESFEITAIATDKRVEEGQALTAIPPGAARSDIITVRRTH